MLDETDHYRSKTPALGPVSLAKMTPGLTENVPCPPFLHIETSRKRQGVQQQASAVSDEWLSSSANYRTTDLPCHSQSKSSFGKRLKLSAISVTNDTVRFLTLYSYEPFS